MNKLNTPLFLSLVVPVFNEEDVIPFFFERVLSVFKNYSSVNIEFIFVNDGSSDGTLECLLNLQRGGGILRSLT